MFRLATCSNLIRLGCEYLDAWKISEAAQWGLKEMGQLFCLKQIERLKPARVLETCAGFDGFFDKRIHDLRENSPAQYS